MDTELLLVAIILLLLAVLVMVIFSRHSPQEKATPQAQNPLLQKLLSRKLWVALGAFFTTMGVVWGVDEATTQQIAGTCVAVSTLVVYIGAEGYADGHSPTNKGDILQQEDDHEQY